MGISNTQVSLITFIRLAILTAKSGSLNSSLERGGSTRMFIVLDGLSRVKKAYSKMASYTKESTYKRIASYLQRRVVMSLMRLKKIKNKASLNLFMTLYILITSYNRCTSSRASRSCIFSDSFSSNNL